MSKKRKTQTQQTAEAQKLTDAIIEAITEQTAEAEQTTQQSAEATAEAEQTKDAFQLATDKELAELSAVAKTFVIRDEHFHLLIEKHADLQSATGEGTDDSVLIGRYGYGSNGKGELISVWCRRKKSERKAKLITAEAEKSEKHAFPCDYGVRFSQNDFSMFNSIAECKELIATAYNEHTEQKHNEPRFSFETLHSATEFLAKLYNAYEKSEADTEEQKAEQKQTTAEQKQKATKQKSRSRQQKSKAE